MSRLDDLTEDIASIRVDIAVVRTQLAYLAEIAPADRAAHRELVRRVSTLEAWRWRLVGAAIAAGAIGSPLLDVIRS